MKNQAINLLIKFGLNEPQAKLYFAGLKLEQALLAVLAREARVKRTTAYYLMDELIRRRFFKTQKIGRRTYYRAATIKDLRVMVKERDALIKDLNKHI